MRTGKTTLTEGIADILGPDRVTQVCTDDYHNYGRKERAQFGADGSLARPEYVKPGRFVIAASRTWSPSWRRKLGPGDRRPGRREWPQA